MKKFKMPKKSRDKVPADLSQSLKTLLTTFFVLCAFMSCNILESAGVAKTDLDKDMFLVLENTTWQTECIDVSSLYSYRRRIQFNRKSFTLNEYYYLLGSNCSQAQLQATVLNSGSFSYSLSELDLTYLERLATAISSNTSLIQGQCNIGTWTQGTSFNAFDSSCFGENIINSSTIVYYFYKDGDLISFNGNDYFRQ